MVTILFRINVPGRLFSRANRTCPKLPNLCLITSRLSSFGFPKALTHIASGSAKTGGPLPSRGTWTKQRPKNLSLSRWLSKVIQRSPFGSLPICCRICLLLHGNESIALGTFDGQWGLGSTGCLISLRKFC